MLMPTQLFTQPKRNKSKRWGGRENHLLRKSKFIRNFYYNIIFILHIGVLLFMYVKGEKTQLDILELQLDLVMKHSMDAGN